MKPSRVLGFGLRSLYAVAGLLAGYVVFGGADFVPYPEVIVPARVIRDIEPDTVVRFVDRIKYIATEPVRTAVAPAGALADVAAFCRPLTVIDTQVVIDTLLVMRSITHSPGWFTQRDRVTITGMTNVGELKAIDYNVRPGWTATTVSGSLQTRYPRTALLRQFTEYGGIALLTWLVFR